MKQKEQEGKALAQEAMDPNEKEFFFLTTCPCTVTLAKPPQKGYSDTPTTDSGAGSIPKS